MEGPPSISWSLCGEIGCSLFSAASLRANQPFFFLFPAVNLECRDPRAGPSCERTAPSQENQGGRAEATLSLQSSL